MPLPADWVDKIFTRLMLRYGNDWVRKWEGLPIDAVKADWAEQLDGFQRSPDRLRYALDNLPEKVLGVSEFKALCNRMAEPARLSLPSVKADPERVQACLAKMRHPVKGPGAKEWAWRLRDRELHHGGRLWNGSKMTKAQRDMWRAALAPEIKAAEEEA